MAVQCAEFGERKGERTEVFGWGAWKISSQLGNVVEGSWTSKSESRRCMGIGIKARLKEL